MWRFEWICDFDRQESINSFIFILFYKNLLVSFQNTPSYLLLLPFLFFPVIARSFFYIFLTIAPIILFFFVDWKQFLFLITHRDSSYIVSSSSPLSPLPSQCLTLQSRRRWSFRPVHPFYTLPTVKTVPRPLHSNSNSNNLSPSAINDVVPFMTACTISMTISAGTAITISASRFRASRMKWISSLLPMFTVSNLLVICPKTSPGFFSSWLQWVIWRRNLQLLVDGLGSFWGNLTGQRKKGMWALLLSWYVVSWALDFSYWCLLFYFVLWIP